MAPSEATDAPRRHLGERLRRSVWQTVGFWPMPSPSSSRLA